MSTEPTDSKEFEESSEDPSEEVVDDLPEVEESSSPATDEDDEDQPTIDDDEMADLAAIAEDVQNGTENDESEDSEDPDEDESGSTEESSSSSTSRSWGKMYTKGVVKTSEAIVDEFGDTGAQPITEQDVRDLELDEAFDEWMAEKTGRPEDIPPGQWVAIGTILLIGGNALTETDLASEALSDAI